jgi:hypothetical protein
MQDVLVESGGPMGGRGLTRFLFRIPSSDKGTASPTVDKREFSQVKSGRDISQVGHSYGM